MKPPNIKNILKTLQVDGTLLPLSKQILENLKHQQVFVKYSKDSTLFDSASLYVLACSACSLCLEVELKVNLYLLWMEDLFHFPQCDIKPMILSFG